VLSSFTYSAIIMEHHNAKQQWQYRNAVKLFLLEMFRILTLLPRHDLHLRVTEV
jgi:hypothetical protein